MGAYESLEDHRVVVVEEADEALLCVLLSEELSGLLQFLFLCELLVKFDGVQLGVEDRLPVLGVEEVAQASDQGIRRLRQAIEDDVACVSQPNLDEDYGSLADDEHGLRSRLVELPASLALFLVRVFRYEDHLRVAALDESSQLHEVEVAGDK